MSSPVVQRCKLCNYRILNNLCTNDVCPNSGSYNKISRLPPANPTGQRPPSANPTGQRPPSANPTGQRPPSANPTGQRIISNNNKIKNEGKIKTVFRYKFFSLFFSLIFLFLVYAMVKEFIYQISNYNYYNNPGIPIVMFIGTISLILLIISIHFFRTSINKKIVGIVNNISLRSIQKQSFGRRFPTNIQVLSMRIIIYGEKPRQIPAVYEHSSFNLCDGDLVEAYGYFRNSEFKIKKIKIKN